MLNLLPSLFAAAVKRPLKLLCLGAHADDIEIGCGAFILETLASQPDCEVLWVVFSASSRRRQEARRSALEFLRKARKAEVIVKRFRDSFFPAQWARIKETFETLRSKMEPDLVLTHYRDDRHQDHRILSDLTWNTFRNHLVLEYEVPKYDGDLGQPNCYHAVSRECVERKTDLLTRHFVSQRDRRWFNRETFIGLMRLRGIECAAAEGFAEAFHSRKWQIRMKLG